MIWGTIVVIMLVLLTPIAIIGVVGEWQAFNRHRHGEYNREDWELERDK